MARHSGLAWRPLLARGFGSPWATLFWQEVVAVQILLARIFFALILEEPLNGLPEAAKFCLGPCMRLPLGADRPGHDPIGHARAALTFAPGMELLTSWKPMATLISGPLFEDPLGLGVSFLNPFCQVICSPRCLPRDLPSEMPCPAGCQALLALWARVCSFLLPWVSSSLLLRAGFYSSILVVFGGAVSSRVLSCSSTFAFFGKAFTCRLLLLLLLVELLSAFSCPWGLLCLLCLRLAKLPLARSCRLLLARVCRCWSCTCWCSCSLCCFSGQGFGPHLLPSCLGNCSRSNWPFHPICSSQPSLLARDLVPLPFFFWALE